MTEVNPTAALDGRGLDAKPEPRPLLDAVRLSRVPSRGTDHVERISFNPFSFNLPS